jgi:hypothetical protein
MRSGIFFDIGNYNVLLKAQVNRKLEIRTKGYESRIPKTTLHVIFLDYDNVVSEFGKDDPELRLKEELQFLQDEFEIGNFHVFGTRDEGRHAVCIDALTFRNVKDIIDATSCDLMFKKAPRINEYRCWVLRTYKKGKRDAPKYLYTVESPFEGENFQSLGHANYLFEKFGLTIVLKNPYAPEGMGSGVREQGYSTSEKHDKEDER